jgi:hypothetical protein
MLSRTRPRAQLPWLTPTALGRQIVGFGDRIGSAAAIRQCGPAVPRIRSHRSSGNVGARNAHRTHPQQVLDDALVCFGSWQAPGGGAVM